MPPCGASLRLRKFRSWLPTGRRAKPAAEQACFTETYREAELGRHLN